VPRSGAADRSYGEPATDRDLEALGVSTGAIPRKAKVSARPPDTRRGFRRLVKWHTGSEGRISYLKTAGIAPGWTTAEEPRSGARTVTSPQPGQDQRPGLLTRPGTSACPAALPDQTQPYDLLRAKVVARYRSRYRRGRIRPVHGNKDAYEHPAVTLPERCSYTAPAPHGAQVAPQLFRGWGGAERWILGQCSLVSGLGRVRCSVIPGYAWLCWTALWICPPRFAGADVRRLDTLVQDPAGQGPMSVHGTHVTTLIFSQPDGSRHSPTTGRRRPNDAARTCTSEDATQPAEWMREAKPPDVGVLSKGDQS